MLAAALAVIACGTANAGTYIGKALPYWYYNGLYINIDGTQMINRPACSTRPLVRLAEGDPNDPIFKAKFAVLLSSWMADKPVNLQGAGTCSGEGDEIINIVLPQ